MQRSTFLKNLIGLYGIASLPLEMVKQYHKVYLLQCFVRGFRYYNGPKIISEINKSGLLELVREPENKYDNNAIALYFNNQKIGFIPMESNEILSVLIDADLLKVQAEITHIEPQAADWEKIHVAIFALKETQRTTDLSSLNAFTLLETPRYYTLKTKNNTYTRIYFEEEEILDGEDFYRVLVDNSSTDDVYSLIHHSFEHPDEMEEAVNESKLIINKKNIPKEFTLQDLEESIDGGIIQIENFFDKCEYMVANINKVATIPDKIKKFEKVLDKQGRIFYEVIFK